MTQDELWQQKYQEVVDFIGTNHRNPEKEESFVVLRGKNRITTYNDDGSIIEDHVISTTEGSYGVNVEKNVWHTVEALEPNSVIFEYKEGPYLPLDVEGILKVNG